MKTLLALGWGFAACCAVAAGIESSCPVSPKARGCENIEWNRMWAVHLADEQSGLPRALLVGDSITEEYGATVEAKLAGKVNVDRWTSSYCLTSPGYLRLLESCLSLTKYDVVHLNNGLHSLGSDLGLWETKLVEALALVRRLQPKAKIVLATSTPLRTAGKTVRVRELNALLTKVAHRRNLAIDDLYALLDPVDRTTGWRDEYHHQAPVCAKLADQVAACVLNSVK